MLESLLGDLSAREFLDRHFSRRPHSRPGGAAGFTTFGGWPAVEALLAAPGVDAFLAREGAMGEGGRTPTFPIARDLFAQGYTLVIRSAERHDAELARLAAGFQADFAAPINVHVYATPAGRSGFGWHYDPEDVFILQTHGVKEYRLRKNTVNPWPLLEQMPKDLRYENEVSPTLRCVLHPHDWLYLPAGWWHSARGVVGDSITLAIGIMTPAAIDFLGFLRTELVARLPWRQRLPDGDLRAMHAALIEDLRHVLADETIIERYLARRAPPV